MSPPDRNSTFHGTYSLSGGEHKSPKKVSIHYSVERGEKSSDSTRRKADRVWPGQVAGGWWWLGRAASQRRDRRVGGSLRAAKRVRSLAFALAEPLGHSEQRRGCVLRS